VELTKESSYRHLAQNHKLEEVFALIGCVSGFLVLLESFKPLLMLIGITLKVVLLDFGYYHFVCLVGQLLGGH